MIKTKTTGLVNAAAVFFQEKQLKDRNLWKKFVDVYRLRPDSANLGWRGEYWGKMMRGGVLVYEYTKNEELYEVLTESVRDMLTTIEIDGRVSSYDLEKEFDGWDMWSRKYVILACEYYLDICKDESFRAEIIAFIRKCADYIVDHIGPEEDKRNINECTRHWFGLNSSSILEPFVKLYRLTEEKKYLDFADYIVSEGGAKGINVFELAYRDEIAPYQYGVSKAYEMMSCFEGLLEYYYVTGIEKYKTAVINFANAVMKTELSVIGCCGITHELFDYTRARQTVRWGGESQETCVTVTWIKFCERLLELTGDSKFADCMEQSFYNAYLGSLNTEDNASPYIAKRAEGKPFIYTYLPVDSYNPLLSGKRGVPVGGFQFLSDYSYYGCCACIAAAGVGMFTKAMVMADDKGITVNFFENGAYTASYDGAVIEITQETEYPVNGKVKITVRTDSPKTFALRVRIPSWTGKSGYAVYEKEWHDDVITVEYPMELRTQLPMVWDEEIVYIPQETKVIHDENDDHYVALMRGPLTLAVDSRMGKSADSVFDFEPNGEICDEKEIIPGIPCLLKMRFADKNGEEFYLVDYSSAGKDWKTDIAAWLRTK